MITLILFVVGIVFAISYILDLSCPLHHKIKNGFLSWDWEWIEASYKGSASFDTGIVYVPYIPITILKTRRINFDKIRKTIKYEAFIYSAP